MAREIYQKQESALCKLERKALPEGLPAMQTALCDRMPEINIVDVLSETDRWTKRYQNRHRGVGAFFEISYCRHRRLFKIQ